MKPASAARGQPLICLSTALILGAVLWTAAIWPSMAIARAPWFGQVADGPQAQQDPATALAAPGRPEGPLSADLSVLWISRAPRFPRYRVDYRTGVPLLWPGTEDAQRFPAPGQAVTLTARVANQGEAPSVPTSYMWELDGVSLLGGGLASIAPGQHVSLTLSWPWQTGSHTITMSLGNGGQEVSQANNRLDHRTDAHYLEILAHPYYPQAFARFRNLVGSYSFYDWLQEQVRAMNQRLAAAIYPGTPEGVPDRVRIDSVQLTGDLDGGPTVSSLGYDGRWSFRPERDDHHTPEDEAWESAIRHAEGFAHRVEWALVHELTHQLGVIDLYWLNVSASRANPLSDSEGLPLLLGFRFPRPGLMGGDDVGSHDETFYSEHTAMGLLTDSGQRRGYFGEYLYDLPDQVWVQVLDRDGNALPGVDVRSFQTDHTLLQPGPLVVGETDESGRVLLPNRGVSPTVTTATGHELRPNPYGQVDVVGRNGQMLLELTVAEDVYYHWLPITELNKAAWRGQSVATVTIGTHFAPARLNALDAPQPWAKSSGSAAQVSWTPIDGAESYSVYRGVWPQFYPLVNVARDITFTSYTMELTSTSRIGITATDSEGNESGFGPLARAEPLFEPFGLAWHPTSDHSPGGQLFVVDAHRGALLTLLPPGPGDPGGHARWIGQVGSEHVDLVDAHGMALGPGGLLGLATRDGQRVWLLDSENRLVAWFGRIADYATDLGRPTALLVGGESLDVDLPIGRLDDYTLMAVAFDDGLATAGQVLPTQVAGVVWAPGRFGQGIQAGEGMILDYPAQGQFAPESGALELWVQPAWPGAWEQDRVLVDVVDSHGGLAVSGQPGFRMRMGLQDEYVYAEVTDLADHDASVYAEVWDWEPEEWHHLAVTWEEHRMSLYVDGRLQGDAFMRHPITGTIAHISIGGTITGALSADAILDEVRISSRPRVANSDRGRVILAQQDPGELEVFDLLGNLLSRYAPEDAAASLDSPIALAWDGPDRLLVADHAARRVDVLSFDGIDLASTRSLAVPWRDGPRALAMGPGRLLAVADGDRIKMVNLGDNDRVVRVWAGPDLPMEAAFGEPVALAFGPQGDLAVAEANGSRISFVRLAAFPWRVSLPGLSR